MAKKLESLLDLPKKTHIKPSSENRRNARKENLFRDPHELDYIASSLPTVSGLGDAADAEFDELAKRATAAYDDLMDLGMNIDPRYSGRIFEVAATMLKNAIDAKTHKMNVKLKTVDAQLKHRRLEVETKPPETQEITGEATIVTDRNSLLEKLKNMNDSDK